MEKIIRATSYCMHNRMSVLHRYRHTYHVMPEIGWCNDPNGFVWCGGRMHLFYQFNPYSSAWDTMHWGHVTSDDMVKWQYEPVALAPDKKYDICGCFSGSAIVKDDLLYIMYTGVDHNGKQLQCLAVSSDGKVFRKPFAEPVINEDKLPDGVSATDFRDPYVFSQSGTYYCAIGTKVGGLGNIAMYRSVDLQHWSFVGFAFDPDDEKCRLNDVYECPCVAEIGDKQVLICSPKFKERDGNKYENVHSVIYMVGRFDCESGRFIYESIDEIDGGFDFYAAQSTKLPDGRTVMTAWMQMWDRELPTQQDGWAGAMVLPRELSLKGTKLIQRPVREIEKYRVNNVEYGDIKIDSMSTALHGVNGKCIELDAELQIGGANKCGVKLFCGKNTQTLAYYDAQKHAVVLDRSKSGITIRGNEPNCDTRSADVTAADAVSLRIFLDNTSIEVFVNDGEAVLTANIYPDEDSDGVEFFAEGGESVLKKVIKYDIVV